MLFLNLRNLYNYGSNKKINHRFDRKSQVVYKKLFHSTDDDEVLYPIFISGAAMMKKKLSTYAEKHLPEGEYWDPEPAVKKLLTELKPTNDLCESILGLNDYLTTKIPNLTQVARSNLVQIKKKTYYAMVLTFLRKIN